MSDVSWWARKLGQVPPTQAPAQPANGGYPAKAVRWQPQYPPTGPRQEVTEWDQPGSDSDDNWHRVHRQGFVEKAPSGLGKDGHCPQCGGSNLFRRKWAGSEAAPLCTECGYNGLYEQSGTLLNSIGMKSSGPTRFAKSDNPDHVPNLGVDASLNGTDFSWSNVR